MVAPDTMHKAAGSPNGYIYTHKYNTLKYNECTQIPGSVKASADHMSVWAKVCTNTCPHAHNMHTC